jgi:hypothetical protein
MHARHSAEPGFVQNHPIFMLACISLARLQPLLAQNDM